jgi:phosphoheptose isomerase|tara:strand:+ start:607 stop:768 length:162 start_codon:yes stop_codon:yes gene_type:complete
MDKMDKMDKKIRESFEESIKVKQKIIDENLFVPISVMGSHISEAMKKSKKLLI